MLDERIRAMNIGTPIAPFTYAEKPKEKTKWYAGDKPTARETVARIYDITQGDDVGRKTLYEKFLKEQETPGSDFYNPYSKPTSYKTTQEVTKRTAKAEAEWAAMQKELGYWAKVGLSDEEAVAKMDWENKYPTLRQMDEKRVRGDALALNKSVGYSQDAMYGILWAARNDGGTGNAMADAVLSAQGKGKRYQSNPVAESRRDPASTEYNPYLRATADPLLMELGVDRIDDEWLNANRDMLRTPQTAELWREAYELNQKTLTAREEYDALMAWTDRMVNAGMSAEWIRTSLDASEDYPTLRAMDEGRYTGLPVALGDAVDYRKEDVLAYAEQQAAALRAKTEAASDPAALDAAVTVAKTRQQTTGGSLLNGGTDAGLIPPSVTNGGMDGETALEASTNWLGISDPMNALPKDGSVPENIEQWQVPTPSSALPEGGRMFAGAGASDVSYAESVEAVIERLQQTQTALADLDAAGLPEEYQEAIVEFEAEKASLDPNDPNYEKRVRQIDDRIAFWQDTAGVELRQAREPLQQEQTKAQEKLLAMVKDESADWNDRMKAAQAIGAWDAAAKLQYDAIVKRLGGLENIESTGGAQAAASTLCAYVLSGEDLNALNALDEETKSQLTAYQSYCTQALGMYEDQELYTFLDAALGGALKGTKYNEGLGFFQTVGTALAMGANKFNDVLGNAAGTLMNAYGYAVEGSEWLWNNTVGALGGPQVGNFSGQIKQAGTDVANYYDQAIASMDQCLRDNASTLEYFAAMAISEGVKMGGEVVVGKGLGGVAAGAADATKAVKTASEALKIEQLVHTISTMPFVVESGAATYQETEQETGSVGKAILSSFVSALVTLSTANLGVAGSLDTAPAVSKLMERLKKVQGAGVLATAKRWGVAGLQFIADLFTQSLGEGAQEAAEYVLTEPAVAVVKGEDITKIDGEEFAQEATGNFILGVVSAFGATVQAMPAYAKSVILAESLMGRGKLTQADTQAIVEAFQEDMADPVIAAETDKNLAAEALEVQTGAVLAQQAEQVRQQGEDLAKAQADLALAESRVDGAMMEMDTAFQEAMASPNPETAARYSEAIKAVEAAQAYARTAAETFKAVRAANAKTVADARAQAKAQMEAVEAAQERGARQGEVIADQTGIANPLAGAQTEAVEAMQMRGAKQKDVQADVDVRNITIPERSDTDGKQKVPKYNPVEIATDLIKRLGIGEYIGSRKFALPEAVLGYFTRRPESINVRSTSASDLSVTMHEIGHGIAKKLNMTGTNQMVKNLSPVFAANYKPHELPGEAFAEFMWQYMVSPEAGVNFAGQDFIDGFEASLREKGIYRDVQRARKNILRFVEADFQSRLGTMVRRKSEASRQDKSGWLTTFVTKYADSTAVASDVDAVVKAQGGSSRLREVALMRNFAQRKAENLLTGSLTARNGTIIGKSLAERFIEAKLNGKDRNLFAQYMITLHSLDRDSENKAVLDEGAFSTNERIDFIARMDQEHPEFSAAEKAFQQFRNEFLDEYLVAPGYMSKELLDELNAKYPHYVPTYRAKKSLPGGSTALGGHKTYTIKTAKGSTETVIDPFDSFFDMVNDIVAMNASNDVALEFDRVFNLYTGLGIFGRRVKSDLKVDRVSTEDLKSELAGKMLARGVTGDVVADILTQIDDEIQQVRSKNSVEGAGYVTAQRADGSRVFYEISNPELFDLLSGTGRAKGSLDIVGRMTRTMSMLTTGGNPLFAIRNFFRDFQASVNQGSWAATYADGAVKWLRAAYDVWRNKGEYQDYAAMGGGGWTRISSKNRAIASETDSKVFKGYETANAGRTAKWLGKKLWNATTLARLNEIVEQTSRYAEYKYGKQETGTAAGRQKAFLNAQDVTVDFSRSGTSATAETLRNVIPFFNASVQAIYKQARMAADPNERSRLPARFLKTVINQGLTSALSVLAVLKFCDEEEKEEIYYLSDDLKTKHIFLPNAWPEVFGEAPFLRIPIAQDGLSQAIHSLVTNVAFGVADPNGPDELAIDLLATANTILDGFNPVSGTIFDPILAMSSNKNWYGGNIVPSYMQQNSYAANQYTATTPEAFVALGRALNISPLMLEYMAKQYTGFLGQVTLPAITKDETSGMAVGLLPALKKTFQNLITSDPLKSNDVVGVFYDGADLLDQVATAARTNQPANMLRRGLTEEEARAAADEAKALVASDGIVGSARSDISALYDEIDLINANDTLTDEQKYDLESEKRREIVDTALAANEAIGAYKEKYVTGLNIINRMAEATSLSLSTAYDRTSDAFKADVAAGKAYALKSEEVWKATQKEGALPRVNYDFSKDGELYTIPEGHRNEYAMVYANAYESYIDKESTNWEGLDVEEKLELLRKAHTNAHNAAKKWADKSKKAVLKEE